MDITEVRIKLMDEPGERLKAFCSITFDDCFVVRDLKIIEGSSGPFVAMPSRKLTSHCGNCGSKNHLRATYCNQCGSRLRDDRAARDEEGRAKLYADIAHPINSLCREMIQQKVIDSYLEETEHSKQPGYVSHYDDYHDAGPEDDLDSSGKESNAEQVVEQPIKESMRPQQAAKPEQPRGPHKAPSTQTAKENRPPRRCNPPDDFGAGIL